MKSKNWQIKVRSVERWKQVRSACEESLSASEYFSGIDDHHHCTGTGKNEVETWFDHDMAPLTSIVGAGRLIW